MNTTFVWFEIVSLALAGLIIVFLNFNARFMMSQAGFWQDPQRDRLLEITCRAMDCFKWSGIFCTVVAVLILPRAVTPLTKALFVSILWMAFATVLSIRTKIMVETVPPPTPQSTED